MKSTQGQVCLSWLLSFIHVLSLAFSTHSQRHSFPPPLTDRCRLEINNSQKHPNPSGLMFHCPSLFPSRWFVSWLDSRCNNLFFYAPSLPPSLPPYLPTPSPNHLLFLSLSLSVSLSLSLSQHLTVLHTPQNSHLHHSINIASNLHAYIDACVYIYRS